MIRDYQSGNYGTQLLIAFYLDTEITDIYYLDGNKVITFKMNGKNCEMLRELFNANVRLTDSEIPLAKEIRKQLITDYFNRTKGVR